MRLLVSIEVGEEEPIEILLDLLETLQQTLSSEYKKVAKLTLLREGDRSQKNLLLPKLSGRMGEHYQDKKAGLEEAIGFLGSVIGEAEKFGMTVEEL